jgi:hypothetical protein
MADSKIFLISESVAKKSKQHFTIKPKEIKMIITKLHFGIALFASAFILFESSVSSKRTTFLLKSTTNAFTKSIANGKSMLIFLYAMPPSNGKEMG